MKKCYTANTDQSLNKRSVVSYTLFTLKYMLVVCISLSYCFYSTQVICQEAILHISNEATDKEYCLVYNSLWTNLSLSLSAAVSPVQQHRHSDIQLPYAPICSSLDCVRLYYLLVNPQNFVNLT